jgi:secreted PhoX family phosphatase
VDRRRFLAVASGMGTTLALGSSFWERALAAPAQPGPSPYGPLLPPDANGVQVPAGFTTRVVARSLQPVPGTAFVWHVFPDGGACVPTEDGGWIYVSNSEFPPPRDVALPPTLGPVLEDLVGGTGGVSAIRFAPDGAIVDAYPVLRGTRSNCAGGLTPWGTWLSCEEFESPSDLGSPFTGGQVWECDPFGVTPAAARPALGRFAHEMAAVDPARRQLYLSEDQEDGLLYRYTPPAGVWGSGAALEGGVLEAMAVATDGSVRWLPVADAAAPPAPLRASTPGATPFAGGEGVVYDDGRVYLTTKLDHRVWVHDVEAQTMAILYDGAGSADGASAPGLSGVDNIIVSAAHDLYVAEDGGNMEVCVVTPDLVVAPVVRMTGPEHGFDNGTEVPTVSEVTGLALSPDGNRLYLNSERAYGAGVLYEVTGPWRGGTLAAAGLSGPSGPSGPIAPRAPEPIVAVPVVGGTDGRRGAGTLARTGGGPAAGWLTAAAAAALLRLRRRSRV